MFIIDKRSLNIRNLIIFNKNKHLFFTSQFDFKVTDVLVLRINIIQKYSLLIDIKCIRIIIMKQIHITRILNVSVTTKTY